MITMENKDFSPLERHIERIKLLERGGKLPCPFCGKGFIVMVNKAAFLCTDCGKGMVFRVPPKAKL